MFYSFAGNPGGDTGYVVALTHTLEGKLKSNTQDKDETLQKSHFETGVKGIPSVVDGVFIMHIFWTHNYQIAIKKLLFLYLGNLKNCEPNYNCVF